MSVTNLATNFANFGLLLQGIFTLKMVFGAACDCNQCIYLKTNCLLMPAAQCGALKLDDEAHLNIMLHLVGHSPISKAI